MKRTRNFRWQLILTMLLSVCSFSSAFAQIRVTGTVTDIDGEALPGVTISIKGTTSGTITGMDGNYSLDVSSAEDILIFSMVGMLTEEIKVDDQSVISLMMGQDIIGLDQVIVVGYGTMRKRDIAGSIVSMDEEDITEIKTFNVLESLQGKVAGVDITVDDGRTGSGTDILIRGKRSLTAKNDPLIIVDGISYGGSLDLNPNDIESIEILKDASSTAIYGVRGANGVILVTTKKGSSGEGKVFFNSYYGIMQPYQKIPVFDREGYIRAKIDANRDENWEEDAIENVFLANEAIGYEAGTEIDWQDICTQNGVRQDYNLGIIGGSEKTTYSASLSYSNEMGITLSDEFKRYNFKLNLETEVKPFLRIGGSTLITYRQRDGRGVRFVDVVRSSPIVAPYDSAGNYIYEANLPSPRRNPLAFTDDTEQKTGQRILGNIYGHATITPDLYFRSSLGVILDYDREGFTYPQKGEGYDPIESGLQLDNDMEYTWTNLLNYSKELGDHRFNLMLGQEMHYQRNEFYYMFGRYQDFPWNLWWNMGSVDQETNEANTNLIDKKLMSFFGRLNYNYHDIILLNATGRYDGASQLFPGSKWDFFPSVSGAIRLKSMSFLEPVELITDLKLRAGWGITGSEAVIAYATKPRLNKFPMYYQFGDPGSETVAVGYRPEFLASDDLEWEITKQLNIGVDLALYKNRISANIDYYNSLSEGLLLDARLPISTGFFSVFTNAGEVATKGVEVMLRSINVDRGDFTWEMNVSFATHREEIVQLTSGVTADIANGWFVGEPIDVFYDYNMIGIWQLADSAEAAEYGAIPGDIRVADTDGNDTINFDDRIVVGSERPKWTGSLVNTFRYKGFDLTVNIYARMGQMIDADAYDFDPRLYDNLLAYDYWTPYNPTNEVPRLDASLAEMDFEETMSYRDGSFIKMKNITFGYSLPSSLLERVNMSRLRIYFSSNNPLILYSKLEKGIDPEREGSISWPLARSVVFGLNVEF